MALSSGVYARSSNQRGDDRGSEELLENTTINSLPTTRLRSEAMFTRLGLRHFGRLHYSYQSKYYGYVMMAISIIIGFIFLFATIVSKHIPETGMITIDSIRDDRYFCYLIPLSLLPTFFTRYVSWLAKQHFHQN